MQIDLRDGGIEPFQQKSVVAGDDFEFARAADQAEKVERQTDPVGEQIVECEDAETVPEPVEPTL